MPARGTQTVSAAALAAPPSAGARARRFASARSLSRREMLQAPVRWPRPSRLAAPLQLPAGKMADGMEALGLRTVGALLEYLPSDSRQARTVATLRTGERATVAVQVRAIRTRPVRRRGMRPLVEATVADASGSMRATFFNQPWLAQRYRPGTRVLLDGAADSRGAFRVWNHALSAETGSGPPEGQFVFSAGAQVGREPAALASADVVQRDRASELGSAGEMGAVAHYPATEGVSSTQILTLVQSARGSLWEVIEALPAATRVSERLPDRGGALAAMHFPDSTQDSETGRRRLAFEELLLAQLLFLRRRARRRASRRARELAEPPSLSERWLERELPFMLTRDQRRVIAEIGQDLREPRAMQRLLMGEVGSGKTVVALHAMLRAVEHGHQAALMAPTETLAHQHFATVQRLLGAEPVAVALLTGSTPARRREDILGKLASGELSLIVGTHALIEPDVSYRELAVAVVDEQHRFGVRQRAALDGRGAPHMLHMTATPIPRTLALASYGDLDVSMLRELPRGRRTITTRLLSGERERERAYEELREQLHAGRQAYVVCPLIEQDDARPGEDARTSGGEGAVRAATAELERLRGGELAGSRLLLLHGGMRPREKQAAMAAFAAGEADVLVATTVIEVGIDVPNAAVMVVENAERFGISQLHQLRGRVGRGEHPGSCFLMGPSPPGSARLRAMVEHSDGFRLAEIDLALRKEGELVGTRQSGLAQFKVACLPQDARLLERARACAEAILAADAELREPEHALLADALENSFGSEALEPIPA
jgi:ATP-dependent DNA helicase RecG